MKIAVSSTGKTMEAKLSEQFGRCQYFIIVETETMKFEAVANVGEQMQSGAGPKAAELIINNGAKVLLTGHVGDKADQALVRGNIKVIDGYTNTIMVKEAVSGYLAK
ncbi:MAG: NifB/NifX family molybdenum-iron cluster-binding protein [Ignavibacteriaceae bacterium]|nr:NifB/NifX family molybdenum-iron cluster-binding protein [Ignavibacteriaceae bacterium]